MFSSASSNSTENSSASDSPHLRTNIAQHEGAHVSPTAREQLRFLERRRAQKLGYELPLNLTEAAAYVDMHRKTVASMARNGEIPAHPVSGTRRITWKFYASELDAWLRHRLSSACHPCSPDGKDTVQ